MESEDHKHPHAEGAEHAKPHEAAEHGHTAHDPAHPKKKSMSNRARFGIAFGAAVVLALIGSVASAYVLPPIHPFVRKVTSIVPLPAAVVGTSTVSIKDFLNERDALKMYFSQNAQATAPATEQDLDKQVLDTLINKKALEALAKARGITVDPAKAEALEKQMRGTADDASFAAQIKTQFGWTPEEFRARVVNSLVLATSTTEALNADASAQKPAKDAADVALARLNKGDAFADVATDASKDPSATQGGDIGYQAITSLPDDIKADVAPLKKGEHSDVIDSPSAYLILQVTDRVKGKDGEEDKLSIIVIPKQTLDDAVKDYLAHTRVWRLIARS